MNKIKITTLSPVHIGDNDTKTLTSLADFIFENEQIKLIDHKKLENIFAENPLLMEDYIKEVQNFKGKSYNLKQFLIKYKIEIEDVISAEKMPVFGVLDGKEIHPFISENGKKYLPGSSVKGAIRNALAYVYLKEHPAMIDKIADDNYRPGTNPRFYDEKRIFGENPFNDVLKFLQISDSTALSENSNSVFCCKTFHLKNNTLTIPINYECIKPDAQTELRLKIKENIPYQSLQIEDKEFWQKQLTVSNIFSALNSLAIAFIERELEELTRIAQMQKTIQFYTDLLNEINNSNNQAAYFCLGKGTTIMGKTILLALERKQLHNLRNKMKETRAARNFGWKFVRGKGLLPSAKLPVTRLIFPLQNGWQAGMGWLKMEIL